MARTGCRVKGWEWGLGYGFAKRDRVTRSRKHAELPVLAYPCCQHHLPPTPALHLDPRPGQNVEAVAAIVDAGVKVANNQVQFSLLDRRPLNGMVQYCQQHGIKLFTYGSVAGGLLSDK